jgi:hypothetical protein
LVTHGMQVCMFTAAGWRYTDYVRSSSNAFGSFQVLIVAGVYFSSSKADIRMSPQINLFHIRWSPIILPFDYLWWADSVVNNVGCCVTYQT